ncbi:ATP-binding cassette domain-containing protein [Cytophagaceae bacterium ABcell3]|nr:ATP-binding cassette domain-containing protein [Cytophagaceae bacterium ABcell3]
MIQLKNISLATGDFNLSDVSLSIQEGSFNVLLGPTGSGKTLILEMIAGLRKSKTGSLHIQGKEAKLLAPEKRNIAYVPQDIALFPHLNVHENIIYGLTINHKKTDIQQVHKLADTLGIKHLLDRSVNELSGGEKQRVALARALIIKKRILLLDEPTAAIHESMQEELALFFKKIQQEYNLTILMTTHHKNTAFLLADYLHFIEKGKILFSTSKETFKHQPIPQSASAFFGIRNIINIKRNTDKEGKVDYWSEELNTLLTFDNKITSFTDTLNNQLKIGFKTTGIQPVNQEDGHANTFNAKVLDILMRENNVGLKLEVLTSGYHLYMDVPLYIFRSFNIDRGANIKCKIEKDDMWEIK